MTEHSGSGTSVDILIQAPNWLGDVVMTTPLLTWLDQRRNRPDGSRLKLHLGIRRIWAPLFVDDPRIDSLVIHERRGAHAGFAGNLRHVRMVKDEHLDAVLIGPPSLRAALVAALARIPRRIGHGGEGREVLLTDRLPRGLRGSRHYSQEMLEMGEALLGETLDRNDLPVTSMNGCSALAPVDTGAGPPVLAVAPGTTYGEAKTWPVSRVADFMNLMVSEHGMRVVLLGDAQAAPFVTALKKLVTGTWSPDFNGGSAFVDLTGRTDLPGVVRVLKACRGFAGNDSGLMHVAAALGVPTVGIFGSSNPDWTAPMGPSAAAVVAEGYACRPCYRKTCNQPRFCLEDVSSSSVRDALMNLMASGLTAGGDG
jgi:heptosyltransferase-2